MLYGYFSFLTLSISWIIPNLSSRPRILPRFHSSSSIPFHSIPSHTSFHPPTYTCHWYAEVLFRVAGVGLVGTPSYQAKFRTIIIIIHHLIFPIKIYTYTHACILVAHHRSSSTQTSRHKQLAIAASLIANGHRRQQARRRLVQAACGCWSGVGPEVRVGGERQQLHPPHPPLR
jgi:hypothetical protein